MICLFWHRPSVFRVRLSHFSSQSLSLFKSVLPLFWFSPSHFSSQTFLFFRVSRFLFSKPVYNGPSTDGPLSAPFLYTFFFPYFTVAIYFFMLYFFHVTLFPCCTFLILKNKENERKTQKKPTRKVTLHSVQWICFTLILISYNTSFVII